MLDKTGGTVGPRKYLCQRVLVFVRVARGHRYLRLHFQCCERGAQFVRRICSKAPFIVQGGRKPAEQPVECADQRLRLQRGGSRCQQRKIFR